MIKSFKEIILEQNDFCDKIGKDECSDCTLNKVCLLGEPGTEFTYNATLRLMSKISFDVFQAKELYDKGLGYDRLGKLFGVSKTTVKNRFIERGWHKESRKMKIFSKKERDMLENQRA